MYGLVVESVGDTRYNTKGIKLQRGKAEFK